MNEKAIYNIIRLLQSTDCTKEEEQRHSRQQRKAEEEPCSSEEGRHDKEGEARDIPASTQNDT